MEKYYVSFLEKATAKEIFELLEFSLEKEDSGFMIEEILAISKDKIKKELDSLASDTTNLQKLKSILDSYDNRQKIYSLIAEISPKLFEKIKEDMGSEHGWKADLNKDLGDLGF